VGSAAGDPPTIVSSPTVLVAVVMRWDDVDMLARAIAEVPREFSIVGPYEAADVLARLAGARRHEPARVFHLPPQAAAALPAPPSHTRLLRHDEYHHLDNLPPILRGELRDASTYSPIASAFVDERPVSFCYSGWETERHWDVSIDTLEGYRCRGLAASASTCLMQHMARRGKTAVWGAVDSNIPSTALARKLGLVEIDRLVVLYPDDAHQRAV
jgi:hypothetical protein